MKRAHWWTWMKARRLLRGSTLTPARFDVLFVLSERGRMMQRALRRVLNVVGSTMSEMLGDLENRGLVMRGRRSRAGRSVELTERGHDAIARAFQAYIEVDDVIGSAFGSGWHACGDGLFAKPFGWIREPDD